MLKTKTKNLYSFHVFEVKVENRKGASLPGPSEK